MDKIIKNKNNYVRVHSNLLQFGDLLLQLDHIFNLLLMVLVSQ